MGLKLTSLLCGFLVLFPAILAQIDTDLTESEGAGGGASEGDPRAAPKVGDLMFTATFDVIMVKKHLAMVRPEGQVRLDCQVSPPGKFRAWIKDGIVVGVTPSLKIKADEPNLFGIYYCAADPAVAPNRYKALQFVITDMPPDDKISEVSVRANQDIALTCKLNSATGLYKWYRYNDLAYKFEEVSGQTGRQIQLAYNNLNKEQGIGFTFYKCVDPGEPSAYQAFKVSKDPAQRMVDGRMTNVYEQTMRSIPTDVAAVPISVTPKSKVTFECTKVNPSENTKWYFRDNSTISPARYNEIGDTSAGVEIQENPQSSVLSVKDCDVKNKGYYRCNVGGVVKYAFLDIRVIVPTIHDYGKSIYDLAKNPGADNELECEIPIGGEIKDVIWRIIPADGKPPYDIPVNTRKEEFETSIKDSGSSQLVTIKFGDNSKLHNYRLECRLGDELDHVTLRSELPPQISVSISPAPYAGYKVIDCNHDARLRDVKFHINKDRGELPIGPPQPVHSKANSTISKHFYKTDKPNLWFRCSGVDPARGTRIYSEPEPLTKDPLMLDIKIDGAPTPKGAEPTIAKVEGHRTEFVCNFSNFKGVDIRAENVKLVLEGRQLPNTPQQVGPSAFKFIFEDPKPSMSGKYFCLHTVSTPGQNVRSMEIGINWCAINQFMCDNRCRDRNIICNGSRECLDGSDEHPSLCSPCEPNEVPCKAWKGVTPTRNCVLKHWLCDGTDDCENGYDEESPISKQWCANTCVSKPWLNCPGNSTCCKSNDKCILRAYECDGEIDCGAGEDEATCCSLTLTDPTRRQLIQNREGSRVTLTCRAVGSERPTISWRCNWGKLRDDTRMKEANRVVRKNEDNTYEVEGTLVIENFTKADECLYNCEAVSKCKRQMSPEFDVKVED